MDSFRAKRSLDNICDERLHSRAYIGKNPFGGYATTRKYVIFPSMALNTSQPLANHSPTSKSLGSKNNRTQTTFIKRPFQSPQTRINAGLTKYFCLFPLGKFSLFPNLFCLISYIQLPNLYFNYAHYFDLLIFCCQSVAINLLY